MGKILLFHDTFLMKGGAERMNIEIAKTLHADIATAVWSKDCYESNSMGFDGGIIEVDPDFRRGMLRFLKMKWKFFNSRKLTENYESILFSNEAITGVWNIKPGTKTYYYAHSISRHLFDQQDQYLAKVPVLVRPFFLIFSIFLKWLYRKEVNKIDTIFVNSQANQRRILDWLYRDDAVILYPSVDTELFRIMDEKSISQILAIELVVQSYKGYYLSFSRLTHAKRIDSIIRAFQKIPDKKIVILYGENDSQKEEFQKMGTGYPNISFHKLIDNNHLPTLIGGSLATIAISENEDFGMVAIESMACGIPVIAVDEGGYRESIIHGKTGYLIDTNHLEENIIKTVQNTTTEMLKNMQSDCRNRAEDFSLKNMNLQIKHFIA